MGDIFKIGGHYEPSPRSFIVPSVVLVRALRSVICGNDDIAVVLKEGKEGYIIRSLELVYRSIGLSCVTKESLQSIGASAYKCES